MSSMKKNPSSDCSSLFAAPSEQMVANEMSSSTPRELRARRILRLIRSHAPNYIKKKILFYRCYSKSIKRRTLRHFAPPKPVGYACRLENGKFEISHNGFINEKPKILMREEYVCRMTNNEFSIKKEFVNDEGFFTKAKNTIFEFVKSNFLENTIMPTIDEFLELIGQLKPINFVNLIGQFASGTSTERYATVNAMLELYDCFWTEHLLSWKSLLISVFTEIIGSLISLYWTPDRDAQGVNDESGKFTAKNESVIGEFFDMLGITLPEEMPDFGFKIFGAIIAILTVVTGGSLTNFANVSFNKLLKRINKFASSIKSLNVMIDGLPKLWTFIMSEVASLFGYTYESKVDEATRMFKEELLNFKIEVTRLVEMMNNNPTELIMDEASLHAANTAMTRLDALYYKLLKEEKNMSATKPIFDDIRNQVTSLQMFVNSMQSSTCRKIEPFVLVLSGSPGIGKSQFVNWFVRAFSARLHQEYPGLSHWQGTTYNRTSTDKFWPGYTGQMFVVYDDFGQIKMDTDHAELILVKNPNKTLLTMSESKEKGRNFSSIGIIGCTNQVEMTSSAVVKCTKALDRRFEIAILCSDPRLDDFRSKHEGMSPGKYEKSTGKTAMTTDINGQLIPYFDENFDHLDFFTMTSEAEEKFYNHDKTEKVTPMDIIELCLNYYRGFRKDWEKSLIPVVAADIFNACDASSTGSNRVRGTYEAAIGKTRDDTIKQAAEQVHKQVTFRKEVEKNVMQWSDDIAGAFSEQLKYDVRNCSKERSKDALPPLSQVQKFAKEHTELKTLFEASLANEKMKEKALNKPQQFTEAELNPFYEYDEILNPFAEEPLPAEEAPSMFLGKTPEPVSIPEEFKMYASVLPTLPAFSHKVVEAEVVQPEPSTSIEVVTNEIVEDLGKIYVDDQGLEEVHSSASAFVQHEQSKGRIVALLGPPGTGKTTLMRKVQTLAGNKLSYVHANDLHRHVNTTHAVYAEDVSITRGSFDIARQMVMQCYDGESPIQLMFITFNEKMARQYCATDEEWDAFMRRLIIYRFDFQTKDGLIFKNKFTAKDVEAGQFPFAKMVSILDVKASYASKKEIFRDSDSLTQAFKIFCDHINFNKFTQIITQSVPFMGRNQFTPDLVFNINDGIYNTCKVLYENPAEITKWIVSGKAKMTKGSVMHAMNLAKQFSGLNGEQPIFPPSIDEFIVLINNSQFGSENLFVAELQCQDSCLVIMPKKDEPKTIRCFKVCDALIINNEKQISDCEHVAPMNLTSFNEYTAYTTGAKEIATKLDDAMTVADEEVKNSFGFLGIWKMFPKIKTFCRVLLFLLKLASGGMSMYTLWNLHKSRFLPTMIDEKSKGNKGKTGNKGKHALGKIACRQFTNWEYDSLKSSYDKYASSAARQKGMQYCIEDYMDICRTDELPINDPAFNSYLETYDEGAKKKNFVVDKKTVAEWESIKKESGQAPNTKQEPMITTIPNLLLEKKKDESSSVPVKKSIIADESLLDPSVRNMVTLFRHQTIEVGFGNNVDTFERCNYGIMAVGRIGVTVSHFQETDRQPTVKIFKGTQPQVYPVKIIKESDRHDLLIFEIEDFSCPQYPSIVHHMPSWKDDLSKKYQNKQGVIATYERDKHGLVSDNILRNIKFQTTQVVTSRQTGIDKEAFTYTGFISGVQYVQPINTTYGDCGSAIIANDTTITTKLVGFHNAGNVNFGCCTLLFQEYFKSYLNKVGDECIKFKSVPIKQQGIVLNKSTTEAMLGMPVAAKLGVRKNLPTRSKFYTSPLALPGENPFQPSVLSANDPRNETEKHPYYSSIVKWNQEHPEVDLELVDEVIEDVAYWYSTVVAQEGVKTKVLTKTEAVNAGKQFEINPLNRQSSPGVPWNDLEKKVQNFLVNKGGETAYYGINLESKSGQKLNNSIDEIINICRIPGNYPQVVFAGNLKDEPVKIKKIKDVNTRSFAGAPLDYTIASRMYFATIQGAIHAVRHKMPIQIGIDATSLEWDRMIKRLLSKSDLGFDLDFKGWDGSVHPAFTARIFKIYNKIAQLTNDDWKEEDDIIRMNLNRSVVFPNLFVVTADDSVILRAPGGMASGTPRTADDNSLIHLCKIIYCVKKILRKHGLHSLANICSIIKLIDCIIYGDDGGYAIHPELLKYINFKTMQEEFAKLGMICTPASKDGEILAYLPVLELEFLKRKTVRIGSKYYGALLKITFHKMLGYCLGSPAHNWYRERQVCKYNIEDLIQTGNAALLESIFHGKNFYNSMLNHLNNCFMKINVANFLPRYEDLVRMKELPISTM